MVSNDEDLLLGAHMWNRGSLLHSQTMGRDTPSLFVAAVRPGRGPGPGHSACTHPGRRGAPPRGLCPSGGRRRHLCTHDRPASYTSPQSWSGRVRKTPPKHCGEKGHWGLELHAGQRAGSHTGTESPAGRCPAIATAPGFPNARTGRRHGPSWEDARLRSGTHGLEVPRFQVK